MLVEKIQRLVDEYLGAVGSAAIVSRTGEVLFESTHDDSASGLIPALCEVPSEPTVINLPVARGFCSYAISLDDRHVLFVIATPAVAPGVIASRMNKAAALLRRVLAPSGGTAAAPSSSGAPALVASRHVRTN